MQFPCTPTNDSHWPVTLLNAVRIATYESEDSRTAIAQCLLGFDHFQQGAYAKAMALFEHMVHYCQMKLYLEFRLDGFFLYIWWSCA